MIRSFLALVSLALLSPVVSAQCADGQCPTPQFRPVQQAVTWAADQVRGPVYGTTGAPQVAFTGVPQSMASPEQVVSLYPGFLRPFGVARIDVVFAPPTAPRTLATPFRGRFRR